MENTEVMPLASGNESSSTPRTEETMFALVELQQQSGKSQKDFCAERGLAPHVFHYWLKKYRDKNQEETGFVQLDSSGSASAVRLRTASGHILEFDGQPSPSYLAELIGALR